MGIILISGCISEEKGPTQPNETVALPAETEVPTTSPTISSPLPVENETQLTQISTPSPTPAIKFEGRYIDVHTHIMPSGMSLTEIIKNMDKEGIDIMVIMEVPSSIYEGVPLTEYGIPDASEKYPSRFIALYGGEAITLLDSIATKGSYTKADEEKYIALIEYAMKSGKYRGFGEIALRHVSIGGEGADVKVSGDHPWMFIMSDIAAKYNVPIDIHMDFEVADKEIAGLEKLLDHNNKTKVIWSHTAWSRYFLTGKFVSVELMRQLLERHPNLYSSIKIQTKTAFMDENRKIKPEWLALFKDYPERFMMGSDIKPGGRNNEFSYIIRHRQFLEQLPPEILKMIERDNAKEIFKIN